jgi:hypothetical protein
MFPTRLVKKPSAGSTLLARHSFGCQDDLRQEYTLTARLVASVVHWFVCLPLDTKIAGSNPAKSFDF